MMILSKGALTAAARGTRSDAPFCRRSYYADFSKGASVTLDPIRAPFIGVNGNRKTTYSDAPFC